MKISCNFIWQPRKHITIFFYNYCQPPSAFSHAASDLQSSQELQLLTIYKVSTLGDRSYTGHFSKVIFRTILQGRRQPAVPQRAELNLGRWRAQEGFGREHADWGARGWDLPFSAPASHPSLTRTMWTQWDLNSQFTIHQFFGCGGPWLPAWLGRPSHFVLRVGLGWRQGRRQREKELKTTSPQFYRFSKAEQFLPASETRLYVSSLVEETSPPRDRKLEARALNGIQHLNIFPRNHQREQMGQHKADADLKSKERWTILQLTREWGGGTDNMAKEPFTLERSYWERHTLSQVNGAESPLHGIWRGLLVCLPGVRNSLRAILRRKAKGNLKT